MNRHRGLSRLKLFKVHLKRTDNTWSYFWIADLMKQKWEGKLNAWGLGEVRFWWGWSWWCVVDIYLFFEYIFYFFFVFMHKYRWSFAWLWRTYWRMYHVNGLSPWVWKNTWIEDNDQNFPKWPSEFLLEGHRSARVKRTSATPSIRDIFLIGLNIWTRKYRNFPLAQYTFFKLPFERKWNCCDRDVNWNNTFSEKRPQLSDREGVRQKLVYLHR